MHQPAHLDIQRVEQVRGTLLSYLPRLLDGQLEPLCGSTRTVGCSSLMINSEPHLNARPISAV